MDQTEQNKEFESRIAVMETKVEMIDQTFSKLEKHGEDMANRVKNVENALLTLQTTNETKINTFKDYRLWIIAALPIICQVVLHFIH